MAEEIYGKHNHAPNFGRRVDGCPRCVALTAGAKPVHWGARRAGESRSSGTAAHFTSIEHLTKCGPVCTFGDW
jgi:hypothetical protein